MASWKEQVQAYLDEYIKKNPPVIGGGRRTIIMPMPQPEDERPRYKTEGETPAGYVRGEICRPNHFNGDKVERLGSVWATVKHQDKPNPVLERVFTGDVIDIPEAEFAKLYEKNWVREPQKPWKPSLEKTKQQAA